MIAVSYELPFCCLGVLEPNGRHNECVNAVLLRLKDARLEEQYLIECVQKSQFWRSRSRLTIIIVWFLTANDATY